MSGRTLAWAAALVLLFAVTALFRFLALSTGFTNDQYIHLANAQQMLFGEWPTRDFLDAGMPLMYVMSALAQKTLGHTLFAEAVLVAIAFGLAAVLTAAGVRELTGSRGLALAAALFEVAIAPRAYGYPKILLYAAALLLLQRYVTRPTPGRLAALACGVVIAFLFRHDHGVYLGAGSLLAVWLAPGGDDSSLPALSTAARRVLSFAGLGTLLALPYLAFVQFHGGLWPYVQKGLEFRDREFSRAEYEWPTLAGDQPLHAVLLYAYWALPIVAVLVLVTSRHLPRARTMVARIAPIVVVALFLNSAWARPPLGARLPDAVVPAVMLGAWLALRAWEARRRWLWRPAVAATAVLVAAATIAVGSTLDQLDRTGLLAPWSRWPASVRDIRAALEAPHASAVMPSTAAEELIPFFDYVHRCTSPRSRLLVVGLVPEVSFFARRPFAGGQAILPAGYFEAERYQRAVVDKLSRQTVPFVVIPGSSYIASFDNSFSLVAAHVRQYYVPLATFGDEPETKVDVLIDSRLSFPGRDTTTGWPCSTRAAASH